MNKNTRFIIVGFLIALVPIIILGKREIAIKYQKQAMDLCPPWEENPDFSAGLQKIDLAIKLAPRNYLFYITKAQFFERQHKYSEAIQVLRNIFDFKKNFAEGYVAIAFNYERLGKKDSAIIEYSNALLAYDYRIRKYTKDPERLFNARLNKAFVLKQSGQIGESRKEFEELRVSYPEEVELINSVELQGYDIYGL